MIRTLIVGTFSLLSFLGVFTVAHAETQVSGTLAGDTTWMLSGSPYVVTADITVPVGTTLTVEPGVVVKFFDGEVGLSIAGTIRSEGTESAPIFFTSIKDDTVGGDTNGDGIITSPTIESWEHIHVTSGAVGIFQYTTIRYAGYYFAGPPMTAIRNDGGEVLFDHSVMEDNGNDGYVQTAGSSTISFSRISRHSNNIYITGGVSTVHETLVEGGYIGLYTYTEMDPLTVTVTSSTFADNRFGVILWDDRSTVHGSRFLSNTFFGLWNDGSESTDATGNWWGSASGPRHDSNPGGTGNRVSDNVLFTPWLTVDPEATSTPEEEPAPTCTENCNSNVMFLPGLQASRLYKPDYDGNGGTDRLWEPNGNADVRDLYLDVNGNSVRSDIYATEVIDEIFGLSPDIYKTFIEMMDDLKSEHVINDWSPIPYDWRLTVDDILNNGTKIQNGYSYDIASATPYIFQELERLAATSTTGKVTIIAHSNGGLVAKALMVRLEQMGKAGLVDKVILLASPQLGTPKAIASLLHGEDQEYLGGLIMDKPTARELGKNMPGGYQLIPSAKYFDVVADQSVIIRNTPSTAGLFNTYGTSTDSIEDLYALLRGDEGRTGAAFGDVESLLNLNASLITQARNLHNLIDGWIAPTSTQVIEIAGWGLDTIRGIRYTDRSIAGCTVGACRRLTYTPLFTDEGDETVVVPSAMATASSTRYWVDLFEANRKEDEKWSHKNISEVTQVKQLVKNILSTTTVSLPSYISQTPSPASIAKKLRYTLHSPLSLGVYDARGRYTGVSSSTVPGVEYPTVIEEIPNSYYMEFGETKIIGFEEGSSTVSMIGEALGLFTLEGEKIEGGITVASTTFPDIPVATGTSVTLFQSSGALSPVIAVDFDGDGTTDVQVGEDGFSETDGVALLRGMVTTLGLGIKQEKRLLTIVDRLDNVVKKEFKKPEKKVVRLNKVLDRLVEVIQKMSQKGKVTTEDKTELLKLIGIVRQQVI